MEPTTFVLFGATGDLAKRKIYPALYNLFIDGKLPQAFTLIGLGRRELSNDTFRSNVEKSLRTYSRREVVEDPASLERFLEAFRYNILDVGRIEDYRNLLNLIEQREQQLHIKKPNRMFYLSVGPEHFETIAANIQASGLGAAQKRLVIEKPFGYDLQSARDLNEKLSKAFAEEEIFRIDHYLGKPMVQKLEILQQSNPVLQALWTNRYIANVQITANETVGVEERAGYYDHVGAVRDMFQNHMLQLLMMLASHLPNHSDSEMVRFKKKKVMEALEPVQKQEISASIIRGQYRAGTIQGKAVAGYRDEPGIADTSMNDTFIAARLQIDDYFWRGVPFYIRTGKRMKEKSTRIVIEFKEPLKETSKEAQAYDHRQAPNLLVFEISPNEGIVLQLNTRDPQHKGEFKPINIDFHASQDDTPEAYENLIHDALNGDPKFFAHWDEVELSWQWVQPILDAFQANTVPLYPYEAGTYGPAASDALLAEDGYHWWFDEHIEHENDTHEEEGEHYAYITNN